MGDDSKKTCFHLSPSAARSSISRFRRGMWNVVIQSCGRVSLHDTNPNKALFLVATLRSPAKNQTFSGLITCKIPLNSKELRE